MLGCAGSFFSRGFELISSRATSQKDVHACDATSGDRDYGGRANNPTCGIYATYAICAACVSLADNLQVQTLYCPNTKHAVVRKPLAVARDAIRSMRKRASKRSKNIQVRFVNVPKSAECETCKNEYARPIARQLAQRHTRTSERSAQARITKPVPTATPFRLQLQLLPGEQHIPGTNQYLIWCAQMGVYMDFWVHLGF